MSLLSSRSFPVLSSGLVLGLAAALCAVPCTRLGASPVPVPEASSSGVQATPDFPAWVAGFEHPPHEARPQVFWYWMRGALSREGITADLEAMRQAGIGGACLMSIKAPEKPGNFENPAPTLGERWWDFVGHAFAEADRLGLRLSMGVSDGFATAGGPWITPELSMQRLTWAQVEVDGSRDVPLQAPLPQHKTWYKDLRLLAYPSAGTGFPAPSFLRSSEGTVATASLFTDVAGQSGDAPFRCEGPGWLTVGYDTPQTLRSVTLVQGGYNYQANRLSLEASDDGQVFRPVCRLEPPRHGWLDTDVTTTHAIPATTARYFRFVHDPAGSEPGSEDLDSAKWKAVLKLRGLRLSSAPVIHHLEGKNGSAWRQAASTAARGLQETECLSPSSVLDLSDRLRPDGSLDWTPPPGRWTLLRIGVTSTDHVNATGGAGKGLECDKLNPAAVRLQFDHWYARMLEKAGPSRTPRVLDTLHVDSWECGSQNWSPVLSAEFRRRRGYPLEDYMPVLAGVPLVSPERSEQFLHDFRATLSELMVESFYGTLAEQVHSRGLKFSGECTAPVMAADGLAHYRLLDIPMGEFWLRSPTHDKPNDIADAISAAHIYGKNLVQAEAFTELRMAWDEHPGMLKTLGDLHFARGINRFMLHVFTHNPWRDRKPGMTLDPIGVYFQRDQTWWPEASAWTDYLSRCQYLLQLGRPEVDIAVFTGEELPSRALLPDRLIDTLPGLFPADELARARERQANVGQPRRTLPVGVNGSTNLVDSSTWLSPLGAYAYDSLNRDALLRHARVEKGRIVMPGGVSYGLLVLPSPPAPRGPAAPLSLELAEKLYSLVGDGATLLLGARPSGQPGIPLDPGATARWTTLVDALWGPAQASAEALPLVRHLGSGRVLRGPWTAASLEALSLAPDLLAREAGAPAAALAWNHRVLPGAALYWISNQSDHPRSLELSLREQAAGAELWDPLTGRRSPAPGFSSHEGRTQVRLELAPSGSVFVLLPKAGPGSGPLPLDTPPPASSVLTGPWSLSFAKASGAPDTPQVLSALASWSSFSQPGMRHFSGTACYELGFDWSGPVSGAQLDLGRVANLARVELNGRSCATLWTAPFRCALAPALRGGHNLLRIHVTNTWANRLLGDLLQPGRPGATWTTAPSYLLEGRPLLEAGLLGPVRVLHAADSTVTVLPLAASDAPPTVPAP